MVKIGEEFERAVWGFVKTLDPNAEVLFDHHVPDRETGKPRQCDVWINATWENFLPLSFYVSCKDYSRPLDQHKIESFSGEISSRRATNGVLFSRSGFTKPALEKAEKLGISCCQLFDNEPIYIKSVLLFSHFVCFAKIFLEIKEVKTISSIDTWNDLFSTVIDKKPVIDYIDDVFIDAQRKVVEKSKQEGEFPSDWESNIRIFEPDDEREVRLKIIGTWQIYTAKDEAVLYNGSYCYNGPGYFKGSFIGPSIDTQSNNPGPGWTLVADKQDFHLPMNKIIGFLYHEKIKEYLINNLGDTRVSIPQV